MLQSSLGICQGESVSTQNVASVHEESPSDQEDQSEGDPPVTVPKCFFWRAQEDSKNSKSHFQAHNIFISSQTRPVITQVVVQAHSTSQLYQDRYSPIRARSV